MCVTVPQGNAEWLDAPAKCTALILWRKIDEWARLIDEFAKTYGLAGSVMTVDELGSGDEVHDFFVIVSLLYSYTNW